MDYQKKKFLDNTPDQPSQFRTENWVEIKPILYGYINAYIHTYVQNHNNPKCRNASKLK